MNLFIVNSGSMGNCYLLESNKNLLVLDAGIPWKSLVRACNYNLFSINAVLISHEHGDHVKCAEDLNTACIPIFGNRAVKAKFPYVHELPKARSADVGGWKVIPFEVPHTHGDGTECQNYAYLIERNCERLLYMTDFMFCPYNLSKFNINHFLIAVNYTDLDDEDKSGKISHVVRGHSSLETVKEFLKTSMTDACKTVIACHLSSRNADESKMVRELTELVPETVNVVIAKKGMTLTL